MLSSLNTVSYDREVTGWWTWMSWDYRRIHLLPGSKLKQKTQNCHSSSDCERAYLAHVVWQIAASVLVQNFNSHSTVLVFQVQTSRLARRQRLKKQIHTFAEWYSQGVYSALGHTVTDNFPLSLLPEYYQLLSSAGRAEGGEPLRWQSKAGELNCFHTYLHVGDASTCIFAIGLKMICLQAFLPKNKSVGFLALPCLWTPTEQGCWSSYRCSECSWTEWNTFW